MNMTMKMPKVADSTDEVVILEILTAVGSHVDKDDVIFNVETDKATVEVASVVSGTVVEIHVSVDDEVVTGDRLVTIKSD